MRSPLSPQLRTSSDPEASGGQNGQLSAAAVPAKGHTDRLPTETISASTARVAKRRSAPAERKSGADGASEYRMSSRPWRKASRKSL